MRASAFLSFALSPRRTACLALLMPLLSLAQSPHSTANAAHPKAPTAPLVHLSLVPHPAPDATPSATAWLEAHDAVAAFPRGHADILAWEAGQGSQAQRGGHASHSPQEPPHHGRHGP